MHDYLDGILQPLHPELLYPAVIARNENKLILAAYADMVLSAGPGVPRELWLVNGTQNARLVLDLTEALGQRRLTVRDCRGQIVQNEDAALNAGLHSLPVPPSGTICLK